MRAALSDVMACGYIDLNSRASEDRDRNTPCVPMCLWKLDVRLCMEFRARTSLQLRAECITLARLAASSTLRVDPRSSPMQYSMLSLSDWFGACRVDIVAVEVEDVVTILILPDRRDEGP